VELDPKLFIDRIASREAKIGVIGLGYVGLPLILEFCEKGFPALGFDVDPPKIEKLNSGKSYITYLPSERIARQVDEGRLEATDDFSRIGEVDAIIICVPTPLTGHREPDLGFIRKTAESFTPHLKPGQLIVLESTTYPGTTDEVLRTIVESGGLKCGEELFLAYSPEREDPGNPNFSTGTIPKVVGGLDEASLAAAEALYQQIVVETVPVSSTRAAEAVKLTENIFRSVNIALVNEMKVIYAKMDIDVWEVIDAAKTKPFGYMPFYPGPGLGGHCIPIDPFYLTWKAREYGVPTKFIELAGEINTAMPAYVIQVMADVLNEREKSLKGSRILIIGLAYKRDVGDARESPSFPLIHGLMAKGADVDYYDPFVEEIPATREHSRFKGKRSIEWNTAEIGKYDAVLISTDHNNIDYDALLEAAQVIVDTRNRFGSAKDKDGKVFKA